MTHTLLNEVQQDTHVHPISPFTQIIASENVQKGTGRIILWDGDGEKKRELEALKFLNS